MSQPVKIFALALVTLGIIMAITSLVGMVQGGGALQTWGLESYMGALHAGALLVFGLALLFLQFNKENKASRRGAIIAITLLFCAYLGSFGYWLYALSAPNAPTPHPLLWQFGPPSFCLSIVLLTAGILLQNGGLADLMRLPEMLALASFFISVSVISGYAFDIPRYTGVPAAPLQGAVALGCYSLAVLFLRTDALLGAALGSRTLGGRLARMILPPALLCAPIFGWLVWVMQSPDAAKGDLAMALLLLIPCFLLALVLSRAVVEIDRAERGHEIAVEAQKRTQEQMESYKRSESERERLAAIVETSQDAIVSCTMNGRIISWNRGAEQLYGYPASQAVGRNISIIVPQKCREDLDKLLRRLRMSPHAETVETTRVARGGRIVPVLQSLSILQDGKEEPSGFSLIDHDISERKRTEEELHQALAANERNLGELMTIIANMQEGLLIVDEDQRIREINQAALTIHGSLEPDLLRMELLNTKISAYSDYFQFFDPITDEPIPIEKWPICRALHGDFFTAYQVRVSNAMTGKEMIAQYSGAPVYDRAGKLLCVVIAIRDVSEEKRIERELIEAKERADAANRAKTAFLANMSHEIRTPLSAILGFSELLLEPTQSPSDRFNCVMTILKNGRLLGDLIEDILDLSKIESGHVELEIIETKLPALIGEVRTLFSKNLKDKALTFAVKGQGAIPASIATDPTRLRQILVNVIGNAVKFTEQGGIEVTASYVPKDQSAGEGWVSFMVKDTGPGIAPAHQDRLFKPFSQADGSTSRRFGGTGLGLALSRELARALGGDVRLAESTLHQGSTFEIRIGTGPVEGREWVNLEEAMADEQSKSQLQKGREQVLAGVRVLLAEDSADNQLLIKRFLTLAGAEVETALDGFEAIEKASASVYDVILMDVQMPGLDGITATQRLRQSGYTGPIIALTAHALTEERARTMKAGCTDHLTKPVNRNELVKRIAEIARNRQTSTFSPAAKLHSVYQDDPIIGPLTSEFLSRLPGRVRDIKDAFHKADFTNIGQQAHKLKGAASNYGFMEIDALADKIEQEVRGEGRTERLSDYIDELDRLSDAV